MKIVFYNKNVPFSGDELLKRSVGGAETALINVSKGLAKLGHNVTVYCTKPIEGKYDNVQYLDNSKVFENLKEIDLFISSRDLDIFSKDLRKEYAIKKTIYWSHDANENYRLSSLIKNIDFVIALSEFHKQLIIKQCAVPQEKILIIHNGVDKNLFKDEIAKEQYSCIYSSTPYRGLSILLDVWPSIKQEVPEAKLYVYSAMNIYGDLPETEYLSLYEKAKTTEGISYSAGVKQDELVKAMKKASLMLYPNSFPETSCITAMEAQTACTPIITSFLGALPETIKVGAGLFINPNISVDDYKKHFINETVKLLKNSEELKKMEKACEKYDFDWSIQVKKWEELFEKESLKYELDKFGFAFGIISDGKVPFTWMLHHQQLQKGLPSGIHWSYAYAVSDFRRNPEANYATVRTEVVKAARKLGCKWLFFNDTDVYIPIDAINRMMSHNKDIVCGLYWMKRVQTPQPIVYNEVGQGPIWDIKRQDELVEVGGAGLGCCLINMDVFDKFDEANIQYFNINWTDKLKSGRVMSVNMGEDHWFFMKAKDLGFKVFCDTNVVCDHYDDVTNLFYPGEEFKQKFLRGS